MKPTLFRSDFYVEADKLATCMEELKEAHPELFTRYAYLRRSDLVIREFATTLWEMDEHVRKAGVAVMSLAKAMGKAMGQNSRDNSGILGK